MAAPASSLSSGSLPLDLVSARRRGSGGCGEARIGEPAFDPVPVGEAATFVSFPSLAGSIQTQKKNIKCQISNESSIKTLSFPLHHPQINEALHSKPSLQKKSPKLCLPAFLAQKRLQGIRRRLDPAQGDLNSRMCTTAESQHPPNHKQRINKQSHRTGTRSCTLTG